MRKTISIVLVSAMLLSAAALLVGCSSSSDTTADSSQVAPLTFIQFYDPDCPFCQAMEPIVANLKAEYSSKIESFQIIDVSTEEGMAKAEEFGVFITPTFFLLDANGDILDKISGAATEENMVKFMERGIADVSGTSSGPREDIPTEGGTEQSF